MARPTQYKKEFDEQAKELCLLGATDDIIAEFFLVNTSTLFRWRKKHESFCKAIQAGKIIADAKVAAALYRKATGFTESVEELFDADGVPEIVTIKKYFPPETQAARLWLLNRQRELWKDKSSLGVQLDGFSDEQLDHIINSIIKKNEAIQHPTNP